MPWEDEDEEPWWEQEDERPEGWSIIVPNPFDIPVWVSIPPYLDTEEEAIAFVANTMGGDSKGRITLVSPFGDEWNVNLPEPNHLDRDWVFVEAFPSKTAAIRFVKRVFFADSKGRVKTVSETASADPIDPKNWDPRFQRHRGGK